MLPDAHTAILATLFAQWTKFMSGVVYPGTNISIFALFLLIACVKLVIWAVRRFFGLSSSEGGNNKKIKVSDERKNDEV